MVASLLRLTGLDRRLESLKRDLEARADAALDHLKSMVVQLAIAAGLVVGAGVFGLLALLVGLVAAYVWAEAQWGPFAALGIIGGGLALLAVVFLLAGLFAARSKAPTADKSDERAQQPATSSTAASVSSPQSTALVARTQPEVLRTELPAGANMVEPFLSLVGKYARTPRTGIEPIDKIIREMQPHAQIATDDAVRRAAVLVQTGDRTTMIAILGAAAALGWLVVRSGDERQAGS
jgi:hypothetical protein